MARHLPQIAGDPVRRGLPAPDRRARRSPASGPDRMKRSPVLGLRNLPSPDAATRTRPSAPLVVSAGAAFLVGLDTTALNVRPAGRRPRPEREPGDVAGRGDGVRVVVGGAAHRRRLLADRYGRRRAFLAGVLAFGGASAVCAVAPSATTLIAARAAQGAAAAVVTAAGLAVLAAEYGTRDPAVGSEDAQPSPVVGRRAAVTARRPPTPVRPGRVPRPRRGAAARRADPGRRVGDRPGGGPTRPGRSPAPGGAG